MDKTNAFKRQMIINELHLKPDHFQGFTKIYKLNVSRMLLRSPMPESPFWKKQSSPDNVEQFTIFSSTNNGTDSQERSNKKANSHNSTRGLYEPKKIDIITPIQKTEKERFIAEKIMERLRLQSSMIEEEIRDSAPSTSKMQNEKKSFEDFKQLNFLHITKKVRNCSEKKQMKKRHSVSNAADLKKRKNVLPQIRQKSERTQEHKEPEKQKIGCVLRRDPTELKDIKSEAYAILEYPTQNLLYSFRGNNPYEIASLTKIMTFYCVRKIADKYKLNLSIEKTTITDHAMEMGGTSAEIITGQVYTLEQLLYGLMLPSGNDAAVALATWTGQHIFANSNETKGNENCERYLKAFIREMNLTSKQLGLSQTYFGNPHGLPHPDSRSTVFDVAKLISYCFKDDLFCKVIATKCYRTKVSNFEQSVTREVMWMNTNKLLRREGFVGVKTGITVTAGPCLASAYKFRDRIYIVVILRASKVSRRFKETRKLLSWALTKLLKDRLSPEQVKRLKQLKKNNGDVDSDYSEDECEFNYDKSDEAQMKRRCQIIKYEM